MEISENPPSNALITFCFSGPPLLQRSPIQRESRFYPPRPRTRARENRVDFPLTAPAPLSPDTPLPPFHPPPMTPPPLYRRRPCTYAAPLLRRRPPPTPPAVVRGGGAASEQGPEPGSARWRSTLGAAKFLQQRGGVLWARSWRSSQGPLQLAPGAAPVRAALTRRCHSFPFLP